MWFVRGLFVYIWGALCVAGTIFMCIWSVAWMSKPTVYKIGSPRMFGDVFDSDKGGYLGNPPKEIPY